MRLRSQAWLGLTLSTLGAFAEGRRHGEEALCLATREGRGNTPIIVHGCLGLLYLGQGDLEHASQMFDQGLALCRASGNRDWLTGIVAGLGHAYALQGRLAEGRVLLAQGISESIRTGGLLGQASRVAWLSEGYRLAGRGKEAWQHARQALALARQQKARGDTRRSHCANSAPSMPTPTPLMSNRPKHTTARPAPWPRSWACGRSWPTATMVSVGCTPKPARQSWPPLPPVPRHGHDLLAAAG